MKSRKRVVILANILALVCANPAFEGRSPQPLPSSFLESLQSHQFVVARAAEAAPNDLPDKKEPGAAPLSEQPAFVAPAQSKSAVEALKQKLMEKQAAAGSAAIPGGFINRALQDDQQIIKTAPQLDGSSRQGVPLAGEPIKAIEAPEGKIAEPSESLAVGTGVIGTGGIDTVGADQQNLEKTPLQKQDPTLQPNQVVAASKEGSSTGVSPEINVKNADIAAIVRIFSRKTGRNYLLDERVKGKVTMYLPGTVAPEESLRILESVLALKGFTSVPIADNLWKIIPSKEARQSTVPTMNQDETLQSASVVTKLINLRYIAAEEVQQLITQLASPDGFVSSYPGTNSLVVIDYEDNIDRIVGIVDNLDIPFRNRDVVIIPVKFADAVDIAEKINELMGTNSKSGSAGDGDVRARLQSMMTNMAGANRMAGQPLANVPPGSPLSGSPQMASDQSGAQSRSQDPKILADERTNSIIVVGDESSIARVKALTDQLDTQLDLSGTRFYVYRCQHANAEELSQVLSGLVGGGGVSGGGVGGGAGLGAGLGGQQGADGLQANNRGMSGRNSRSARTSSRLSSTSRLPGSSRNDGSGRGGAGTVQLGDRLSVTADRSTNSLIIYGNKEDYGKLLQLLERLDVKRRQVLVEAAILEVSLDSSQTMGTDFLTSGGGKDGGIVAQSNLNGANGLAGVFSDPTKLSNFTLAAASAGTLTLGNGDSQITLPTQTIVLNAAKNSRNVNVLSAPTLLSADNEQAEIVVGQNIPFLASQSTNQTNLDNTFNQIDRQDVGITLRITPQISSEDYVTLRIFTDVSSVVPEADKSLGPTTTVRSSETTVITRDGQMVVIGGLIADENNDSDAGVPFLQDVPVLGYVFKRSTLSQVRRNLLTFITPRIIKDQFDARDTTISQRDKAGDLIKGNEVYPDRKDLLESDAIDSVAEKEQFGGAGPGTLLPPEGSGPGRGSEGTSTRSFGSDKDGASGFGIEQTPPTGKVRGTLSFKAKGSAEAATGRGDLSDGLSARGLDSSSDKLPRPASEKSAVLELNAAKTKPQSATTSSPLGTSEVVVNLKLLDTPKEPTALPFSLGAGSTLSIVIPKDSLLSTKEFFQVGSKYAYVVGKAELPMQVMSRSLSSVGSGSSGAVNAGPNRGAAGGQLYRLSPYEIMNLGKGPWLRR